MGSIQRGYCSEHGGTVQYVDMKENLTYREEPDEQTGHIQKVVIDSREKSLIPGIAILNKKGSKVSSYPIPTRAHLNVADGETHSGRRNISENSPRHRQDTRYHRRLAASD